MEIVIIALVTLQYLKLTYFELQFLVIVQGKTQLYLRYMRFQETHDLQDHKTHVSRPRSCKTK